MDDFEDRRVQRMRAPRMIQRERLEQEGPPPKKAETDKPAAPEKDNEKKNGES